MESRPKRQSKKSEKLLTYELETLSSARKQYKKSVKQEPERGEAGELLVPKLTIKLGKGPSEEPSTVVKAPGKRGRKRKKPEPEELVEEEPPKKKDPPQTAESSFPTDVEIEVDEDSDSDGEVVAAPASQSADSSASKRQRKLPAKLADGEFDTETDLGANKAAKFFETKKAEQKAATALAKQEASKAGKKKRNRMPTAYTMWCNSYRVKLQAQDPGMSFAAMNKHLGEAWWNIAPKEKNQWNRKAKRLATHGTPKTEDSLKYLGTKAIASLQRNNCLPEQSVPKPEPKISYTNLNPVYKVTQTEPVDIAAHFSVMADALTAIGTGLASNREMAVQGSLSVLLDSLLCGMSALMCLTQQIPELDEGIDPELHKQRMADIALFMPNIS